MAKMNFYDMHHKDLLDAGDSGSNYIKAVEDAATRQARILENIGTQWELETAKHLAIINSAGIAGCFALAAFKHQSHILWPLLLFCIGMAITVIVLFSTSQLLFFGARQLNTGIAKFYAGHLTPTELFNLAEHKKWYAWNVIGGFIAFGAAIVAGFLLFQQI